MISRSDLPQLSEDLLKERGISYEYLRVTISSIKPIQSDRLPFDDSKYLERYVKIMNERAPKAEWCAAGIGANQIIVNEWAIAAGGHTRSGLEDNVRLDKNTLAPSNAALIQRASEICEKYERPVATWRQTREMLNLQKEI